VQSKLDKRLESVVDPRNLLTTGVTMYRLRHSHYRISGVANAGNVDASTPSSSGYQGVAIVKSQDVSYPVCGSQDHLFLAQVTTAHQRFSALALRTAGLYPMRHNKMLFWDG
jgi:hypothetical protein